MHFSETRLRSKQLILSYLPRVCIKVVPYTRTVFVGSSLSQGLAVMYLDPRVFVHPFRIFSLALETSSVADALVYRGETGVAASQRMLALRCRKCVSCNPISNLYCSTIYHPNLLRRCHIFSIESNKCWACSQPTYLTPKSSTTSVN